MMLYIEGHSAKLGYAVSLEWSDAECSAMPAATTLEVAPVRFFQSIELAARFVARWNSMFSAY